MQEYRELWYSYVMTNWIYKDTYHDPISYLAVRKDTAYQERIENALKDSKDQVWMNKLVNRLMKNPENFQEFEASLDMLWKFIKEKVAQEENTRVQIHAIQPRNIEWIPLGKLPSIDQQKKPITTKPSIQAKQEFIKNTPSIDIAMRQTFSKETYNKFLVAYDNYMSLDKDVRLSIFNLSKTLKIPHEDALWLMATESEFNTLARSPVWAEWLAQVMPGILRWLKNFIEQGSAKVSWQEWFFAKLRWNPNYMSIYRRGWTYENISVWLALYSYHLNDEKHSRTNALRIYNGWYRMPNVPENIQYPTKVIAQSILFRWQNIQVASK